MSDKKKRPEEVSPYGWDWPFKDEDGRPRSEISREVKGPFEIIRYSNGTFDLISSRDSAAIERERRIEHIRQAREQQRQAEEARDYIKHLLEVGEIPGGTEITRSCGVEFESAQTLRDLATLPYPKELHKLTVVIQVLEARYGEILDEG